MLSESFYPIKHTNLQYVLLQPHSDFDSLLEDVLQLQDAMLKWSWPQRLVKTGRERESSSPKKNPQMLSAVNLCLIVALHTRRWPPKRKQKVCMQATFILLQPHSHVAYHRDLSKQEEKEKVCFLQTNYVRSKEEKRTEKSLSSRHCSVHNHS